MFYRLSHIDDAPLPCHVSIGGTTYIAVRGGLLLEPPRPNMDNGYETDGHSSLKLFGMREPTEAPDFIASSEEPYRWVAHDQLKIARLNFNRGAEFAVTVEVDTLELRAVSGDYFLPLGTKLRLSASPDEPISSDWSSQFDFGPPMIQPAEPHRRNDPAVLAEIQAFIAAGEPERLRAVRARLEHAWRAPA